MAEPAELDLLRDTNATLTATVRVLTEALTQIAAESDDADTVRCAITALNRDYGTRDALTSALLAP